MANPIRNLILRPISSRQKSSRAPSRHFGLLISAVALLFTVVGFFNDLMNMGRDPIAVVLMIAFFSGLDAVLWLLVMSRGTYLLLALLVAAQFSMGPGLSAIGNWMIATFGLHELRPESGVRFAGASILIAVIASYVQFIRYIQTASKETARIQNELDLAHGIQKTLVPPILLRTPQFEVYGLSQPSEKVGGDLVDALLLPNGDLIAYLADIAGHGLSAGILMGMLKTAPRTVLLDAETGAPGDTLPQLLEKLNRVLPAVKEPQMYATITAFRLNANGEVWMATAASPPVLHWAPSSEFRVMEEKQFPLGLLPVTGFTGEPLQVVSGDLLVVATDGVLEVCDDGQQEFGLERLQQLIAAQSREALPAIGEAILAGARKFGKQTDDQTMLLIRRR